MYTLNKGASGEKLKASGDSQILKFCLETPNDVFEKYREAVINYSKYKEAGVLELEACLKATKVLASIGKRLEASDFLQNTIYIGIKVAIKILFLLKYKYSKQKNISFNICLVAGGARN